MSKFKIGDKVRWIKYPPSNKSYNKDYFPYGWIGEIIKYNDENYLYVKMNSFYPYCDNTDDRGNPDYPYCSVVTEDEIELVEDTLVDSLNLDAFVGMNNWPNNSVISTLGTYWGDTVGYSGSINNNKKTNIMSKITSYVKNLTLSADEKLLRKYGLHDDCGDNTSEGKEAISHKFYNSKENQDYLITIAKGLEEEANKNK